MNGGGIDMQRLAQIAALRQLQGGQGAPMGAPPVPPQGAPMAPPVAPAGGMMGAFGGGPRPIQQGSTMGQRQPVPPRRGLVRPDIRRGGY